MKGSLYREVNFEPLGSIWAEFILESFLKVEVRKENWYSIVLWYFEWQYCIDTRDRSIDLLSYKLLIRQILIFGTRMKKSFAFSVH